MSWVIVFLLCRLVEPIPQSAGCRDGVDTTQVYTLKRGENIAKVLQRSGLPRATSSNIISALKSKLDLSKCRKGDKLYIMKSNDKFVSLKYEQSKSTWVMDSLMIVSKLKESKKLVYLQGAIKKGSLWEDLISAGGTPQLIYQFANEVFPWDIDFNTETRRGDKFEVLATAKYIEDRFVGYDKILFARYISRRGCLRRQGSTSKREFTGVYYSGSGAGYYTLEGTSLRRAFLKSPIRYFRISSGYSHSRLHPILHRRMPHLGVDYAAPKGTPVRTIGDGKVVFAGWKRGFGNQVIIQHPNGFKSYYGHLSGFSKEVRKGKFVAQGELIGWVGSTGLSTGPHLDFRVQEGNKWINPLKLKSPPADPLTGKRLEQYRSYTAKLLILIEGINTIKKLSPLSIVH